MPTALRVLLRLIQPSDRDRPLPWLPEAVAAIAGRGAPPAGFDTLTALCAAWDARYPAGVTLLGTLGDGEPLGAMRLRGPEHGRLVIDALTVRAERRNLGYGQELVFAAEEQFAAGAPLAAAGVPRGNGLAVYFWLRTGYRPHFPDDGGHGAVLGPERLWMVRPLP